MANKDYVRRGHAPGKKRQQKKAAPRRPWRSGLVAIVLVAAFGYGLYVLNGEPSATESTLTPAQTTKAVTQSKASASPIKKSKNGLPPPPIEKWDYVDMLPNRQIEVTAKELAVSDIPYIMQCGAYKTLKQAETRKAKIAFQGLVSKVRKKEDSSWYRVVLGPYKFKRDAERDKHKLQRAKIEPCAIWKETQ